MDAPVVTGTGHPLSRRQFLAAAAATAAAAALPAPFTAAAAKAAADRKAFFESGHIPHIEVKIEKAGVEALRQDRRRYVKAKVKEDGKTTYEDIGVRIKGSAGSVRDVADKPALTLNMDKFEENDWFHGMSKWHLNNSVQDPSYTTDLLCSDLYRSAGVPTTLTTYAKVSLNGKMQGFYVLKEGFDRTFLKAHFGNADGNLYDGGFLQDIDGALQLDHGKVENPKRDDLKALLEAAREPDRSKRLERLDKVLDLDRFVNFLALEMLCWDWDGYPMQRNNYRIYFDSATKKATFLPSGMDQMWHDPNGPLFPQFNGVVAAKFMSPPDGRKRYLSTVRALMDNQFRPDPLVKKLDELQARIRPVMKEVDRGAADGLPGQIDRVRDGIRQRAKVIAEQLKREKA